MLDKKQKLFITQLFHKKQQTISEHLKMKSTKTRAKCGHRTIILMMKVRNEDEDEKNDEGER